MGARRLPPLVHELIERVPLHVEDYPSEDVMRRLGVEYIDDLCGLYTGIPIGEKSVSHSGTLPDVVTDLPRRHSLGGRRRPRPHLDRASARANPHYGAARARAPPRPQRERAKAIGIRVNAAAKGL